MTYDGTKDSLRNIVKWLEGTDTQLWGDMEALAAECVSDLVSMARPQRRPDKTGNLDVELPIETPFAARLNAAIPHAEICGER